MRREYRGPAAMSGIAAGIEALFALAAIAIGAILIAVVGVAGFVVFLVLKATGVL